MMQLLTSGGLGRQFRSSTDVAAYQKIFARQQEEQRLRRERNEDLRSDDAEFMDAAMSVISMSEIADFRMELEIYDTATITALQENEIELAAVRERHEVSPALAVEEQCAVPRRERRAHDASAPSRTDGATSVCARSDR